MTDQQELDLLKQERPDVVAAIRALIREEIKKWAEARRDGLLRESSYIEKQILQK